MGGRKGAGGERGLGSGQPLKPGAPASERTGRAGFRTGLNFPKAPGSPGPGKANRAAGGGGEAAEGRGGRAASGGDRETRRVKEPPARGRPCVPGVLRRDVKHAQGRRRYYLLAREGSVRKVRD